MEYISSWGEDPKSQGREVLGNCREVQKADIFMQCHANQSYCHGVCQLGEIYSGKINTIASLPSNLKLGKLKNSTLKSYFRVVSSGRVQSEASPPSSHFLLSLTTLNLTCFQLLSYFCF